MEDGGVVEDVRTADENETDESNATPQVPQEFVFVTDLFMPMCSFENSTFLICNIVCEDNFIAFQVGKFIISVCAN